jgi:hypothetical protein
LAGNIIRVLDADTSAEVCKVDLASFDVSTSEGSSSPCEPKISLLSFNDDIVTIHYEKKGRPNNNCLLIFSTKQSPPEQTRLLIPPIRLESSYKLFARHTADCVYYGTHSAEDAYGHHEWEIKGVALSKRYDIPCTPLRLEKFFGTDIRSTIAFEIHGNHFYAVSNQTSFEVEEIDWTSFYHCIRFPLEDPTRKATEVYKKVYRRQHDEGPIHDSWTDITIQFDEATKKAMIIEARREWLASASRQQRTFYISEFEWEKKSSPVSEDGSPVAEASEGPLLPEDDPFVGVLDSRNNPSYAPREYRPNSRYHPETTPECGTTRSFILARTKFKGYNYSCSSFFDFVEDERCCSESSAMSCLRIRIGTRREAPMDLSRPGQDLCPKAPSISSPYHEDDVVYRHSPVRLWPPPSSQCACSKRLHHIINPDLQGSTYSRSITGMLDERRFVYIVRPGRSDNASGVVVVINFSRGSLPLQPNKAASADQAGSMEDQFNPTRWNWIPGACKRGACR